MKNKQTCILVLGMHRSGTSAFTGVLNILDVFIGDNLLAATSENEKGYFENGAIYDTNESLLKKIESSWDDMFFNEDKLNRDVNIDDLKSVIEQEFKNEHIFAIKDPRLSYLFPFYKKALDELGISIKVMIPYRNPLEVAKSLQKRNLFSLEKGMLLWSYSVLLAEKFSRDYDRIIISFDDLMFNTKEIINQMSKEFHLDFDNIYECKKKKITEFLEPNLKHHNIDVKENLPEFVTNILVLLEQKSNDIENFDKIREDIFVYQKLFYNKDISDIKQIIYEKDLVQTKMESLGGDLKDAREIVEKRDGTIDKLNELIKKTGSELEYSKEIVEKRDGTIDKLNELIKKTGSELEYSKEIVEKRDLELIKITNELINRNKAIEHRDNMINNMKNTILELEDIAQSLRIKNRIKRFLSIFLLISNNPKLLSKAWFHIKNGNIKYLISKTLQKRDEVIIHNKQIDTLPDITTFFENFDDKKYTLSDESVDIIIPVYNGYEFLEPLFDSIEKNTHSKYRLLVVNDASSDENVKPYLSKRLKKFRDAIFIDNEKNLGFVKSVNKGVALSKNHFVILNTDTEVPEYWLERLMKPIFSNDKIATTTPFTNSGTIASFPNFLEDNKIFLNLSVDELDNYFKMINPQKLYEQVPTGVGFCMGVNKSIVKELGFFDEETFHKGYGEENDWCQRAIKSGFINIMVPNLFIYHKHGGSFLSEDKKRYIEANLAKLSKKHPNYSRDIELFIQKNPYKLLRDLLILIISANQDDGVYIIIDHTLGGGANHYTNELMLKYKKDDKKILHLAYNFYSNNYEVHYLFGEYNITFTVESFLQISSLLLKINVKEMFLNELVSHKNIAEMLALIQEIKKSSSSKLTIPIHDFFSICPSYTLLNANGEFCNVPDLQECNRCMSKNKLEWKSFFHGNVDMYGWRDKWFGILDLSDEIICFSNSSKTIIKKAYPMLDDKLIKIIPHTIEPMPKVSFTTDKESITIGVLGAINYAKGADIIQNLVSEIDKRELDIDVVVIGEIAKDINSDRFKVTGQYDKKELTKLIEENNIDIFFIPSIWPETFSYTTQEIISMKLPLMVFNLGAPAQRVKNYKKGYIVNTINISSVLSTVFRFKKELANEK